MKSKILYIFLAVGILVALINIVQNITDDSTAGSKAEAQVINVDSTVNPPIKNVTFLIDNSGSMRGYVDFSGNSIQFKDVEKTFNSTASDFMSNCENILGANTIAVCNGVEYKTQSMTKELGEGSVFEGRITEIDGLIERAGQIANDSTLCIIVSDLIPSYGKRVLLKKGKFFTSTGLPSLAARIKDTCKKHQKKEFGFLLAKYESDYNGKYYYNYTENIEPNSFRDSVMHKRPFYFLVIGNNASIKQMCNANCLPAKYEKIFTSLKVEDADLKNVEFSVKQPNNQPVWTLGNPYPDDAIEAANRTYTISYDENKNLKTFKSKFNITIPTVEFPLYIYGDKLSSKYNQNVISSVSPLVNNSSFKIETREFEKLPKSEDVTIEFISPCYNDYSSSSIDDDIQSSLKEMESKTWGIASIIEAMYEAYDVSENDSNTVISVKFKLQRK